MLLLLLFIRWVVSIRWAFFKNLFGCGLSALCQGWELERIHDLDKLLNVARPFDTHFDDFRSTCKFVEEFYTEERRPFLPSQVPSRDEFDKARRKIEEMIAFILKPQEPSAENSKPTDLQ